MKAPRLRLGKRPILLVALTGALLLGAWLWLRDSSLVAVKRVTISGVSGPDAPQIRSALATAARKMTTLNVHSERLRAAVARYPLVKELRLSTSFPHTLRIQAVEQIPVAHVATGGHEVAVASDGTLLRDIKGSGGPLPTIQLAAGSTGSHLSAPEALHAAALLGAAPYQLLARIEQVSTQPQHGLVAQLRGGPRVYFGDPGGFGAKWVAAVAVLGDAGSAGAAYLDVSDPSRPVAGGRSATSPSTP